MDVVNWSVDMALGIASMDKSHQALLNALAQLCGANDAQFPAQFTVVVEAVETDFRDEEADMERIEFSGTRRHREEHARVLAALHHVEQRVLEGDIDQGREAIRLLPEWFLMHQASMDRKLAEALRAAALV